ncbi:MAG: hypothetical protein EOO42_00610 [Flavobacteriales bacterium]|nr:MAG: hypothetical protein EOO42_00610 [Flavobacteriales bacterium]
MLEKGLKQKIYDTIVTPSEFIGNADGFAVINKVWNLRNMESTDARYKDAYGDFRQHMINNDDWTLDEIFHDKLNIMGSSDDLFIYFLEAFVDPSIRSDVNYIQSKVDLINSLLIDARLQLKLTSYLEERPIFKVQSANISTPAAVNLQENKIIFNTSREENFTTPCFLISYSDWDDYSYRATVKLEYWASIDLVINFGFVRIMKRGMAVGQNILEYLPKTFTNLSDEFCSLCDRNEYYFKIKEKFPDQFNAILYALKDCAMYPRIAETFEHEMPYKRSLTRDNSAEQVARTVRFTLAGIDYNEAFKFRYDFKPPYSDNTIDLDFNFAYETEAEIKHRIYVLIGQNGAGKTRILSGIAEQLGMEKPNRIGPLKPLFSKVFTLSYSIFDRFEIQKGNHLYNYVYCGLKKSKTEHYTDEELRTRFLASTEKITERSMVDTWRNVLSNFITEDVLQSMFTYNGIDYSFKKNDLAAFDRLSSGQHILMYVLTEMLAEIRNNSLILYDEPETHLHPNAISELMNSLLGLVKNFNSFCIIGTHSPLIVQCVQSRNVYVVKRSENDIELRTMERETYGENLTVITEEIFGNREIEKDYLDLLTELVKKGHAYEDIVQLFERENGLPMNLNVRLQLKQLFV